MFKKSLYALGATAVLAIAGLPAAAQAQNCDHVVAIHNTTNTPIYYVYITNVGVDNWGSDWLDEDESIAPGATTRFNMDDRSGARRFDVKITYKNRVSHEIRNVDSCAVTHIDANANGLEIAY